MACNMAQLADHVRADTARLGSSAQDSIGVHAKSPAQSITTVPAGDHFTAGGRAKAMMGHARHPSATP